jgi:hypothetical protein
MENLEMGNMLMLGSLFKSNNPNYLLYFAILNMFITYVMKYGEKTNVDKYIRDNIRQFLNTYFTNNQQVSVELVSHVVQYTNGYSDKQTHKNIFSPYFLGMLHYLKKNKQEIRDLKNTTELLINKLSDTTRPYWKAEQTNEDKFLFIPENDETICIDEKLNIHMKLSVRDNQIDDKTHDKRFEMRIMTFPKDNTIEQCKINLHNFLEEKRREYEKMSEVGVETRFIYEYKGTETCDGETTLKYNEFIMEHNKELQKNIFFENKQMLLDYIEPFIYDKNDPQNKGEECYINAGMTFKAGLLFYGSPGCGKTSTIKGILKYCNRHAIIVNLSSINTNEELEDVFRNRKIKGKTLSGKEICYILEDCDATRLSSLQQRNSEPPITQPNYTTSKEKTIDTELVKLLKPKGFDLSCFLNVLDGIIELHGVMIIITTNHPEKLDEALIRPGRIDYKYEFKKANLETIHNMLMLKYNKTAKEMKTYNKTIRSIREYSMSPACVQSICFKHKTITECIRGLIAESTKC